MKYEAVLTESQRDLLGVLPFNNFSYSVHISLKNNYVYLETPKAGCSTIKYTLARLELEDPEFVFPETWMLHHRSFFPTLSPLQVGDFAKVLGSKKFFKFCFVRNPYERLLSAYLDKIARPSEQRTALAQRTGLRLNDKEGISFSDFVDVVCDQSPREMDNHWRPQYHQTLQDKVKHDFVGRAECLNDDLLEVGGRLNCNIGQYLKIERQHAQAAGEKLDAYMTADLQHKVFTKFEIDFEHFEYDFRLPA